MTPEQWQQLLGTLGDAGSQLYAAAARQAQLDAVLCAIATIALCYTIAILVKTMVRLHKDSKPENENEIYVIILGALLVLLVLFTYLFAYEAIAYLLNPQWAIYETIASLVQ